MSDPVSIVDLFSGPGGLGEGFASLRGPRGRAYRISLSIEKDPAAHATLRLRAFLRRFDSLPSQYKDWLRRGGPQPDWAQLHPTAWGEAEAEARCLELGTLQAGHVVDSMIHKLSASGQRRTLLIGGPPCQAYSLAGRSRNAGNAAYDATKDGRHFLYQEYVRVLRKLKPVAFVMENVKGMLSSSVEGRAIFRAVSQDLSAAGDGYRLVALSARAGAGTEPGPKDFVVRSEEHGVPQERHRVIIVGIRSDVAAGLPSQLIPRLLASPRRVTIAETIGDLPRLRSGLSRKDGAEAWSQALLMALDQVEAAVGASRMASGSLMTQLGRVRSECRAIAKLPRSASAASGPPTGLPADLKAWLIERAEGALSSHETRGHMPSDLARYLYAACHGRAFGVSPRSDAFPALLAPKHRSWASGKFKDRFRVQLSDEPCKTITSHIAKDGHYFIHYDPLQCRSLTVREAARLQTFPDDYAFLGNRTEQYTQVGNAVPPWLARQIGEALLPVFERI